MKTKEQIVEYLANDGAIEVYPWYFVGKSMTCNNENCCDGYYASFEEAADMVIYYSSRKDLSDVEFV